MSPTYKTEVLKKKPEVLKESNNMIVVAALQIVLRSTPRCQTPPVDVKTPIQADSSHDATLPQQLKGLPERVHLHQRRK